MRAHASPLRRLFQMQGPLLILIVLMFLIFLAQAAFGEAWYVDLMAVPGKIVAAWNQLRAGDAGSTEWGIFGTLLSCAFLHGDLQHVLFNMLYLWIFAGLVSELLGWRWLLIIFLFTSIAASITHTAMNHESFIPTLGASGAVMGFEGAYLGLAARWHLPDPHIWPIARPIPPGNLALVAVLGVSLDYYAIMDGTQAGIAYGAHVGGFTMGLFITALVAPKPRLASVRSRG